MKARTRPDATPRDALPQAVGRLARRPGVRTRFREYTIRFVQMLAEYRAGLGADPRASHPLLLCYAALTAAHDMAGCTPPIIGSYWRDRCPSAEAWSRHRHPELPGHQPLSPRALVWMEEAFLWGTFMPSSLWTLVRAGAVDLQRAMESVRDDLETQGGAPSPKGRTRRRRRGPSPTRPLTSRQLQVAEAVTKNRFNITAAAKELQIDPKTVREAYEAALAKLSAAEGGRSRSVAASRLPQGRRGEPLV